MQPPTGPPAAYEMSELGVISLLSTIAAIFMGLAATLAAPGPTIV